MEITKIKLNGCVRENPDKDAYSDNVLTLDNSYKVGKGERGASKQEEKIISTNDKIIEFIFEDGTTWISGADSIDTVFPEAAISANIDNKCFEIPNGISSGDINRGIGGKVLLKIVNIFTKRFTEKQIRKLAEDLENKQLKDREGLFLLNPDFELKTFIPDGSKKPYLLLIHGTATSIEGSFGDLEDSDLMNFMRETYVDRILAFQYRTLTKNPLENVLELIESLPENCVLHLITTSCGGLVGEVLSRFCNNLAGNQGFNPTELSILKKGYSIEYNTELLNLIKNISVITRKKNIKIERFIRIACPAGGTRLASKRFDTILNITLNLTGVATGLVANPIYLAFKNLISAIVGCKNKANVLPGLEVLAPDSPFIKALNCDISLDNQNNKNIINNSLIVISGNSKVSFRLNALWIIASKIFFQHNNDLIVDTESMVMGTRRGGKVLQFFYEDNKINHFNYFDSRTVSDAILRALKSEWGESLAGFTEEPLALQVLADRNILLKLEGGHVFKDIVSGSKPILILLPGIMGSNLGIAGKGEGQENKHDLIWINYGKLITGGLADLSVENKTDIGPQSLVGSAYKSLVESLEKSYDVVTFPYDWRFSLEESASKLDELVNKFLKKYDQPIKIIGHSMGGVLVRDFIVNHHETWEKLNKREGFRLIFLGAPLNGSFRIPAVLFGRDRLIKKLGLIDVVHTKKELIEVISGFRGLLGLMPFDEEGNYDFSKPDTWNKMMKATDDEEWPIPSKEDLTWFSDYRKKMKEGLKNEEFTNVVYIAGRDKSTPNGCIIANYKDESELDFLCTAEGDQSVTWKSGIPQKLIDKKKVYYVNVTHGSLACEPTMFNGIKEILATGSTNLFSSTRPVVRGDEIQFRMNDIGDLDLSEMTIENDLLGIGTNPNNQMDETPIKVILSHGDLSFSNYPLMAGHFENDGILYAEKVIDNELNNALSQRHQIGLYPGPIGTSEVFISPETDFKGAVIIGLGKPEELTASELVKSIEQGVASYLLHLCSSESTKELIENEYEAHGISSLLIASGYAGLSIENSIKAIIQGVHNANIKVKNLKQKTLKAIEVIEIVELYEDKTVSALYSLRSIERDENKSFKIILEGKNINKLPGSQKRIPKENSEEWWNRITVTKDKDQKTHIIRSLKFSASTSNAQEKVEKLFSTPVLMEGIIEEMSTNNRWTKNIAKAIFELLIPNNFKEQLKRHGNINWIVDSYTASYPWELLQDNVLDSKPICVSSGMIRQLYTKEYRNIVRTTPKNNALVIADPDLRDFANQLPGALKEGHEVLNVLRGKGVVVESSFRGNHSEIIEKLFCNEYRIIHLSGHGIFNADITKGSGMVIGDNLFLSTRELEQLSVVPDLVFVNCCHIGKSDGVAEELYQKRYKLSANIGTHLIKIGVKCVIAAGWAVDDSAALEFARIFYRKMFEGYNFGESVKEARKTVYTKFGSTNTWGAYQCYGDPFYKFEHITKSSPKTEKTYIIPQEAEVDLMNLLNELELRKRTTEAYIKILEEISAAVDKAKIRTPVITEKEARVYQECGDYNKACEKFVTLFTTEDASFSFSVAEKYYNSRAKQIVDAYKGNSNPDIYSKKIDKVIRDLKTLIELSPTSERINILASTLKRRAYISSDNKHDKYFKAAIKYQEAYKNSANWYSLTNWLALESALILAGNRIWRKDGIKKGVKSRISKKEAIEMLIKAESSLDRKSSRSSYWNMLANSKISMCRYLIQYNDENIKTEFDNILNEIRAIWEKAGSKSKRMAEIEQLGFLIDILGQSGKSDAKILKEHLSQIRGELEQIVEKEI